VFEGDFTVARVGLSADRIVTTAEALIRVTGSTEWTVRALCKELECAPGAIYRYFPGGVDAIGAEIRNRHLIELAEAMAGAEANIAAEGLASLAAGSVAARLSRRARCYLAFARRQGEVYRSLFAFCAQGRDSHARALAEDGLIARHAELIRQAAAERELTRPSIGRFDSEQLALMIWGRLHGHADLALSGLTDGRCDELDDRLLIDILGTVGFKVAAYPAGLEAAARAARQKG
jgi:AcrR family transcriptional regulator